MTEPKPHRKSKIYLTKSTVKRLHKKQSPLLVPNKIKTPKNRGNLTKSKHPKRPKYLSLDCMIFYLNNFMIDYNANRKKTY